MRRSSSGEENLAVKDDGITHPPADFRPAAQHCNPRAMPGGLHGPGLSPAALCRQKHRHELLESRRQQNAPRVVALLPLSAVRCRLHLSCLGPQKARRAKWQRMVA